MRAGFSGTIRRLAIDAIASAAVSVVLVGGYFLFRPVDGRPIAFHNWFVAGSSIYLHRNAFDASLSRYGPGLVALRRSLAAARSDGPVVRAGRGRASDQENDAVVHDLIWIVDGGSKGDIRDVAPAVGRNAGAGLPDGFLEEGAGAATPVAPDLFRNI